GLERFHDRVDAALEHFRQVMPAILEAVVGDAVLEEVIGANLLGPVPGTDLAGAERRVLRSLLLHREGLELRGEDAHGLLAVGELRALRGGAHVYAGWRVDEADRRLHLVHVLAASAARAREFHLDI